MCERYNQYEMYQIAYLTMNGWVCNSYDYTWTKSGKKRTIQVKTASCCDGHPKDQETEEFDLDSAFDEEYCGHDKNGK